MDLLEVVLCDLADDRLATVHKFDDSALALLLKEYHTYSRRIEKLPNMTDTSTCRDLKNAIAIMAPEDQIKLFFHYYIHQGTIEADPITPAAVAVAVAESVEVTEERTRQFMVLKALLWISGGVILLIAGAVLAYTFNHNGTTNDDPVIGGLLSTAAEIARILLSVGD